MRARGSLGPPKGQLSGVGGWGGFSPPSVSHISKAFAANKNEIETSHCQRPRVSVLAEWLEVVFAAANQTA